MRLLTLSLLLASVAGSCRTARRDAAPDIPLSASVSVPPGLDSAATERWLAEQRRACRGRFFSVFDENMIGRKGPDSTVVFRYERTFSGVQCVPAIPGSVVIPSERSESRNRSLPGRGPWPLYQDVKDSSLRSE